MGHPRPLLVYFRSFQTQIPHKQTVGVSRIRTRIIGVEGEHADLSTTTTGIEFYVLPITILTKPFVLKFTAFVIDRCDNINAKLHSKSI